MKKTKLVLLSISLISVLGFSITLKHDSFSGLEDNTASLNSPSAYSDTPKVKIDTLQFQIDKYNKLIHDVDSCGKRIEEYEQKIFKLKIKQDDIKKRYDGTSNGILKYSQSLVGAKEITFNAEDYFIFVADLDSHSINLHWKNNEKKYMSIGGVFKMLESKKEKPLMITNAGMYTPQYSPQGLYIENGNSLVPLDTTNPKTDANFYLKPNGVFYIDMNNVPHIEKTEDFEKLYSAKKIQVKTATQSGPMLVSEGELHKSFTYNSPNRKIRSGVGLISNKKVVFAISKNEVNFCDFAILFKDVFGCRDALFLDGAISMMYLRNLNPGELGGNFGPIISVTQKVKK